MAGGRGAAEIGAGANRRTKVLRDVGKRRQLRPELRQVVGAVETDEAVVLKLQAQTIHKQLQVECSMFLFLVSPDCMLVYWLRRHVCATGLSSHCQQFPALSENMLDETVKIQVQNTVAALFNMYHHHFLMMS